VQNRRESNIDRWETVKVLMSDTMQTKDGTEVGISLVVNKPIFKDGNEGFPKASMVISRNGSSYRIPFFKGSSEEPTAIVGLMEMALKSWREEGHEEYEDFVAAHRAMLDARKQRGIDDHNKMLTDLASEGGRNRKDVGGGLSKFSKTSKRERRKQKRRRHESRQEDR
jgi:hypothetical protein